MKSSRTKTAPALPQGRHKQDIFGLSLFFAGAASLLCLTWHQNAPIPDLVDTFLRLIAGTGAYLLPILLMFFGGMFLLGYERFTFSRTTYGAIGLFLVFVTWRHLLGAAQPQVWNGLEVQRAGGGLGWLFGASFTALLGTTISHLLLVCLFVISVVLMSESPFAELAKRIRLPQWTPLPADALEETPSEEKREEKRERLASRSEKAIVRTQDATLIPAPSAPDLEDERAKRAALVVEKALTPSGKFSASASQLILPEAEADESNPLTRLFNLTRGLRVDDETQAPSERSREEKAKQIREKSTGISAKPAQKPEGSAAPLDFTSEVKEFVLPPLTLLKESPPPSKRSQTELEDRIKVIEKTLEQFNIGANVIEVASGPTVTRYEIQLAPGIKVSKIVSLADNLAMSMAAIDVRVEAPIPGKSAIGLEVPNQNSTLVTLRECLETDEYKNFANKVTFALGKDVSGNFKYADLTRMPHLLIGGSTNSGKSVCLNVLIASLVYRATPRDLRLLMIDPKRVELSLWEGIPHLMHPVVTDVKQAAGIFRAAIKEMDRRYDLFSAIGTRNIDGYNGRVPETEKLPYLVLIVDELADLMMQQGPEIEQHICRLAQLARATGIHLVIATQRPSVDIITGTIKANISSRIAFAVASQVDSRTILDMTGADRLIGRGDMLFMPIDAPKPIRIQGCYLSEDETRAIVDYLKEQEKPDFAFTIAEGDADFGGGSGGGAGEDSGDNDEFFEPAVRLVVNNGQASTSMLQRRFRIGYTRAARIVEMMEERGIVGGLNGAKPREILITKMEVEQLFNPGGPLPGVDDDEE